MQDDAPRSTLGSSHVLLPCVYTHAWTRTAHAINYANKHARAHVQVSGTVFSILANVDQFYQYNYRENFMHAEGGEAAAPGAGGLQCDGVHDV